MSKLEKYAIFGAALFGIATILLGVIMLFIFPSTAELSQGFRTPINSFEFARTDADLAFLSGSGERRSRPRSNLQAVGLLSLVWVAPCLRAAKSFSVDTRPEPRNYTAVTGDTKGGLLLFGDAGVERVGGDVALP